MERKSYLKICKLFINNLKDKLPIDNQGKTPKDDAEENGDVEILNMFEIWNTNNAKIKKHVDPNKCKNKY